MADLWLAVPARVLRPGLVCFGFLGRVLPELAGLGRMKVNSNVPPIARVWGGTLPDVSSNRLVRGLSRAARLLGVHPPPLGGTHRQWTPCRLHGTCKAASEARVEVLGCALGTAQIGAGAGGAAGVGDTFMMPAGDGCVLRSGCDQSAAA